MNIIEQHNAAIINLCKKHKVSKLYVFGSVLTERFNDQSDVDFIVDFTKMDISEYADNYFDLKDLLEKTIHRKIDLLENSAISNPYLRQTIDSSKQLVYGT